MPYTIRELATEFKVSKQAIRKQLEREPVSQHVTKKNINGVTTKVIDEVGYKLIQKHYKQVTNDSSEGGNEVTTLKLLQNQLEIKDKQIETLQRLLDQQQQLQLNSIQTIHTSPENVTEGLIDQNNTTNSDKQQTIKKKHWFKNFFK